MTKTSGHGLTHYRQSWKPGPAVRPPGQTLQLGSCAAGAGCSAESLTSGVSLCIWIYSSPPGLTWSALPPGHR